MLAVEQPERIVVSPAGGAGAFVVRRRADGTTDAAGLWAGSLYGEPRHLSGLVPDTAPAFSPNGAQLAIGVQEDGRSRVEIGTLDKEWGTDSASVPLGAGFIEALTWSASGLLALIADPGSDSASLHSGRLLPGSEEDPRAFNGARSWRRVWHVDPDTKEVCPVTREGLTVWEFAPLSDGRIVAICSDDPSEDGWYHSYLALLPNDATLAPVVLHRSDWQLSSPAVNPSGTSVAFVEGWSSDRGLLAGDVVVIELADAGHRHQQKRVLHAGTDATWISWEPDGRLWFAGWHHLSTAWGWFNDATRQDEPTVIHHENAGCVNSRWHPAVAPLLDGGALTVRSTPHVPPEVVRMRPGAPSSAWSSLNTSQEARPFTLEPVSWEGTGGIEIEGLLALPVGGIAPFPLVVEIHGGPSITWHQAWDLGWAELFTASGFAVLMPNPRGGAGRGQAFARLNHGDPAGAELLDIVAGIQRCAGDELIDVRRVGAIGTSYGGYLSAWAACTPEVVAAAVVIAGVTDLISCRNTANNRTFYDYLLKETPQSAGEAYLKASPITAVTARSAPTLILHGEADTCVPVGQAYELYHELVAAAVPTELVVYPREGHETLEPAHIADQQRRALGWFEHHLMTESGPTERITGSPGLAAPHRRAPVRSSDLRLEPPRI